MTGKNYKDLIYINENNFRFFALAFFLIIPFIYLSFNLFKLQIRDTDKYQKQRDEQHSFVPSNNQNRGAIYAKRRDGELVPLAVMKDWYKLTISPKDMPKDYIDRAFDELSKIVTIDRDDFVKRASKINDPYEEITSISPKESAQIEALNLVGVKTYKNNIREYPLKEAGSKVIGFVGDGAGGEKGRYGLEKYYNDVLQVDAQSTPFFLLDIFEKLKANNLNAEIPENQDIVTSLEPNVMMYLYKFLGDLKEEWQSDTVAGIIMNTHTGEIIAMDQVPSYDPNKYSQYEASLFTNETVQGAYELGSIFKPLTMALGIDKKLITPLSYFKDTGSVFIDGYTIKNFDGKIRGDVTMQTVLSESLNTGVVYVMRLLGRENFREGLIKLGIEEDTGIDLPGEISNKTKSIHAVSEVDYATTAFGQGIALSPISMLRTLSIIVNGGNKVDPFLVEQKIKKSGKIEDVSLKNKEQVLDKETADTVKKMMIENIDKGFGAGKWKDDRHEVGAKTGTAQLVKPRGGYYDDKFLHSYFTFFGSGENQLAVLVYQVNPKRGELASITLTPAVNRLKDFLINYYEMKPDR